MPRDPDIVGCIRVHPALNEAERDFLLDLLASERTLRGTPTGRGDASVPFARLAWEPCRDGCCLEWNGDEEGRWMEESLLFLVAHLFAPGAKAQGRARFAAFTFDHVLDGAVIARPFDDSSADLVTVVANQVSGRTVPSPCESQQADAAVDTRPRPDNVIELRPRRARGM
ncbi:hypothetical protein [Nocardioides sp. SYSU D00065]|uniref:hypothetical protein n=1 Tax=Nocardioides sp. SYSU D00065 TaxID=2817378 RepID=UPI001B330267|nr:hypothetical protein [Nocardioides sp. SYSU D00065]